MDMVIADVPVDNDPATAERPLELERDRPRLCPDPTKIRAFSMQ